MNPSLYLFKMDWGLRSLLGNYCLPYSALVRSLWMKIPTGCSSTSLAWFPGQAAGEPGLLSSAIPGLTHRSRVSGTSDDTARNFEFLEVEAIRGETNKKVSGNDIFQKHHACFLLETVFGDFWVMRRS